MNSETREIVRRLSVSDTHADEQVRILTGLDDERREETVARLEVVDRFLRTGRTAEDAKEASELLGTGVRNLYRLISRIEDVGPVAGLVRGYRAAKGGSDGVSEGSSILLDEWLGALLRNHPDTSRARAEAYVLGRVDAFNEMESRDADMAMPTPTLIAARMDALKRSGVLANSRAIGERVLIDQVVLSQRIADVRSDRIAATFIVDRGTTLILGMGVAPLPDWSSEGLIGALADLPERLRGVATVGFGSVSTHEVEWVVPPALVGKVDRDGLERDAPPHSRKKSLRVSLVEEGERRHAVRLVKILGNGIGRHRFLTRASLDFSYEDGLEGRDPVPEWECEIVPQVRAKLAISVDRWNASRAKLLLPSDALSSKPNEELSDLLDSLVVPAISAARSRSASSEVEGHA